ncbi:MULTISPECIES: signal peptidase II [Rhodobacterales]|uniref:Lipoprotein signal peptidase n=1 Tax=Allosediminivita pacifica TaxID=1267769 RepID=A0A2T6ADG3_9RHOB|nr:MULTISPECIES: signal peptidase II [Rhodobacterales]MAM37341.1 signal peptidase II [Erythrobacter sp.]PTX41864.1 signal peptidase II [Allosediminivita pacifica]GGB25437.1 lipoprotein signal peptidase [Allosediminivita pacifica]|tara:strand:- start:465 stop:950 length:486 start_codon:yes stop_codon:yes gene_type:complete
MKRPTFASAVSGCIAVATLATDQTTKALASANGEALAGGLGVFPGFNLVFHRNTGVSFGMLGDVSPFILVALALVIAAWIAVLAFRTERSSDAVGYGLILGGAIGNVADRVRFGGVTDFLDFYIGETHWPAFNLADTAIFCGVVVLLFWPHRHVRQQNKVT